MENNRTASCSCGQLVLQVAGDPVRVSICHCLECQKRTGSAFGHQARFHDADIMARRGSTTAWTRTADSGNAITFHFCPVCGSTVFYRLAAAPGFTVVAVGAFADPAFPAPSFSVYETRRHGFVGLPEDMEHMD